MQHHAIVIEAGVAAPEAACKVVAARVGIRLSPQDPDVRFFVYETLGINEVRALAHTAAQKPSRSQQWLVAAAVVFTVEAQNALLKLLEDPPSASRFIIIIPRAASLLPTVRSRVVVVRRAHAGSEESVSAEGESFLSLDRKSKLRHVGALIKKGDKEGALSFLDSLEAALARQARANKEARALLYELSVLRAYLLGRAPSLKQILEYVAITCPIVYS